MAFRLQLLLLTTLTLIAFAGNSVLCRLALATDDIDPASFTIIRLVSGAVVLALLVLTRNRRAFVTRPGSWKAALMLFLYAALFSYAYISIDAGAGALILFGAVQITMLVYGVVRGHRLSWLESIGIILSFAGLLILLLPGTNAPNLSSFILMALSGIAWGAYTLMGKGSSSALLDNASNFIRTLPICLTLLFIMHSHLSAWGLELAVVSGAVTSGLGYAIWYRVLPELSIMEAAVSQLTVPIIAAVGGVIFLTESITLRLVSAAVLTLGGVFMVVMNRQTQAR